MNLYANFQNLFLRLAPNPKKDDVGGGVGVVYNGLINRMTEPHRHYHTMAHILDGLKEYENLISPRIEPTVFFAWAFHDCVYDAKAADDNEARSAMVFERDNSLLGFGFEDVDKIVSLILSTKHSQPGANVVTDMDLAGLGSDPAIFDRNTANIRKEYGFVSEETWRTGRAEFLREFLKRAEEGNLYRTTEFKAAYTQKAKLNLLRELSSLQ